VTSWCASTRFIDAAGSLDELATPPNYGLHPMVGNRSGTWSMTVTKNWRMTFRINDNDALIEVLDYTDATDTGIFC
jgi:proteic killer suppression protein